MREKEWNEKKGVLISTRRVSIQSFTEHPSTTKAETRTEKTGGSGRAVKGGEEGTAGGLQPNVARVMS